MTAGAKVRALVWAGALVAVAAMAGLAAYFAMMGLDAADKLASVIGGFVALAGLGVTVYGLVRSRSSDPGASVRTVHLRAEASGKSQVYQVGGDQTINRGLHIHLLGHGGTVIPLVAAILSFAVLITVVSVQLASKDSSRQPPSPPVSSSRPTTASTPTPSSGRPVNPAEVRKITVYVPSEKPTTVGDIGIAVETVGFTSTNDGTVDCAGDRKEGAGSCVAIGGKSRGSSTIGIIDFSVITPAQTCKASSMHINESVVVAEHSGRWARIVVLSIGPIRRDADQLPVTFEVSRGLRGPTPRSPRVCVPS